MREQSTCEWREDRLKLLNTEWRRRGEEGSIGHFFKKICNNGRNVTWWPFEEEERVREALLG